MDLWGGDPWHTKVAVLFVIWSRLFDDICGLWNIAKVACFLGPAANIPIPEGPAPQLHDLSKVMHAVICLCFMWFLMEDVPLLAICHENWAKLAFCFGFVIRQFKIFPNRWFWTVFVSHCKRLLFSLWTWINMKKTLHTSGFRAKGARGFRAKGYHRNRKNGP